MTAATRELFTEESPEFIAQFNRPWARVLVHDEEGDWLAEILELRGCHTGGRSAVEALERLDEALTVYLLSMLDRGDEIPVPRHERQRMADRTG